MTLLAVADEIDARDEGFFATNVLGLDEQALLGEVAVLCDRLGVPTPEEARDVVLASFAARGIRWQAEDRHDPVMAEILRGVSDAGRFDVWGPAPGLIPPRPVPVEETLASRYRPVTDRAGAVRAFVAAGGGRPVVLLNALGLPLRMWSRLLADDHGLQMIVPVLPCTNAVEGGMIETMSAQEVAVVLHELIALLGTTVDVVGWCNAGRIALELARLDDACVDRIVLVTPTFRGGPTRSMATSAYEDELDRLFCVVSEEPRRARLITGLLQRVEPAPDWDELAADPRRRATTLFGLPRQDSVDDLRVPMATPGSLVHYARRTHLDEAINADMAGLPGDRITLIRGADDSVVSNVHTSEWMAVHTPGSTVYEVTGSGHYLHDLQYPYLRLILRRILLDEGGGDDLPARVRLVAA